MQITLSTRCKCGQTLHFCRGLKKRLDLFIWYTHSGTLMWPLLLIPSSLVAADSTSGRRQRSCLRILNSYSSLVPRFISSFHALWIYPLLQAPPSIPSLAVRKYRAVKGICRDAVIPMKLQLERTAWLVYAYKTDLLPCAVNLQYHCLLKTTMWLTAKRATCCLLQDVIGIRAIVPIMSLPVLLLLLLLGQLASSIAAAAAPGTTSYS